MPQETLDSNDALETQRLNLEAMSHELTERLNLMIAQQEQRVKQFITIETAESQTFDTHEVAPSITPAPTPQPIESPAFTFTRGQATHSPTPAPSAAPPFPPAPAPGLPQINIEEISPPMPENKKRKLSQLQRRIQEIQNESNRKALGEAAGEESNIGLGRVIAFIVIFIFIARGCAG